MDRSYRYIEETWVIKMAEVVDAVREEFAFIQIKGYIHFVHSRQFLSNMLYVLV